MRHTTGTVCIHLQLATWDPENISFHASNMQSDFIFKSLLFFFFLPSFQPSESKTIVGQKGKNKQTTNQKAATHLT